MPPIFVLTVGMDKPPKDKVSPATLSCCTLGKIPDGLMVSS